MAMADARGPRSGIGERGVRSALYGARARSLRGRRDGHPASLERALERAFKEGAAVASGATPAIATPERTLTPLDLTAHARSALASIAVWTHKGERPLTLGLFTAAAMPTRWVMTAPAVHLDRKAFSPATLEPLRRLKLLVPVEGSTTTLTLSRRGVALMREGRASLSHSTRPAHAV